MRRARPRVIIGSRLRGGIIGIDQWPQGFKVVFLPVAFDASALAFLVSFFISRLSSFVRFFGN